MLISLFLEETAYFLTYNRGTESHTDLSPKDGDNLFHGRMGQLTLTLLHSDLDVLGLQNSFSS